MQANVYRNGQKTGSFSSRMNGRPERSSSGAEASFGIICHGQILDRRPYKASTAISSGMDTEVQKKGAPRQNSRKNQTIVVRSMQSKQMVAFRNECASGSCAHFGSDMACKSACNNNPHRSLIGVQN